MSVLHSDGLQTSGMGDFLSNMYPEKRVCQMYQSHPESIFSKVILYIDVMCVG